VYPLRNQNCIYEKVEEIKFGEFLLLLISESFVFQERPFLCVGGVKCVA
jgi:hypothetical protein